MPFIPHTPESLLPRSDSKNPATTCKGITSSGRPCRRSIATAKSPTRSSASATNGVLAVVSVGNGDKNDSGAAAFFCWQHKDQAEQLVTTDSSAQPREDVTKLVPLKERSSIDTLVARLGVLEIEELNPTSKRKPRKERYSNDKILRDNPPPRINRPPTWENVPGPLMSVPEDLIASTGGRTPQKQGAYRPPPRRQRKQGFWEALCCMGTQEDDYVEVVRHKKRVHGYPVETPQSMPAATPARPERNSQNSKNEQRKKPRPQPSPGPVPQPSTQRLASSSPVREPLSDKPARPINKPTSSSRSKTSTLLSYIPTSLSPQTTSLLLAELSKPISQYDDEGFIYIFWLTSEASGPPPATAAASLLTLPSRPANGRRPSDIIRDYSNVSAQNPTSSRTIPGAWSTEDGEGANKTEKKTMLLKIGRASNVHRRMNEWTRQCGYSLSLVRFYPYIPSTPSPSPSPSPSASPENPRRPSLQPPSRPADPLRRVSENSNAGVRKVPHAHRVERLIHIELGERRVKRDCEACGKEHREWFEVDATREGVKDVDEVVRRWVNWAERAEA